MSPVSATAPTVIREQDRGSPRPGYKLCQDVTRQSGSVAFARSLPIGFGVVGSILGYFEKTKGAASNQRACWRSLKRGGWFG